MSVTPPQSPRTRECPDLQHAHYPREPRTIVSPTVQRNIAKMYAADNAAPNPLPSNNLDQVFQRIIQGQLLDSLAQGVNALSLQGKVSSNA